MKYEKHGMQKTSEYNTWTHIKDRCHNTKNSRYKDYGGRGITVCEEWRKIFKSFYEDMGDRPEGMSLDRIDNNKGYSKENCRWATTHQQNINQRIRKDNKSGVKGVYFNKRTFKWIASINISKKQKQLGSFDSFELAVECRKAAEIKYYSTA